MTTEVYRHLENYMLSCMQDSAHDKEHVYRVLFQAMEIADAMHDVDYDVLITACLLHDIGRKEQFENPSLCHAAFGAQKAENFLLASGFSQSFCDKVVHCIRAHRFRKNQPPQSLEAKILFDADKLDVTGAVGIARTLQYQSEHKEPLYCLGEDGTVSDGTLDEEESFFGEYKFKLEKLYDRFFTEKARGMAADRQKAAVDFYQNLYREVSVGYTEGREKLQRKLQNSG